MRNKVEGEFFGPVVFAMLLEYIIACLHMQFEENPYRVILAKNSKNHHFWHIFMNNQSTRFFWEIGLLQFQAIIVRKLCEKNKDNR